MKKVRVDGISEYQYQTAYVDGQELYIVLDMDFSEAQAAFQGATKLEMFLDETDTLIGNYPVVDYLTTTYGGGALPGEIGDFGSEAKDMATVRFHVLTSIEQAIRRIETVQAEHDAAIAEIYGGLL